MTLFPFFPYEHTDGGECAARFINGVPCNARRRGEKPPQSRRKAVNGRVPPSSRKILLSAQKNFRESLLLLYHFPAPLGKPFAADFSLLFKGERACSRKGGRARPNAKGGGLRPCGAEKEGKGRTLLRQLSKKNPRTDKERRQQPRTGKGSGSAQRQGAAEFSTSVEKFFRSYYTFLSKALTMAVFCGMMKKKAPFCTYLCGSVFLKGKHNAICDLNCALCGCARAGIRAVLRP